MDYRKFGRVDWKVSALGFGTMRLPVKSADWGDIDEPEAIKMLRYAIDHGVNYIDSAYGYHAGNADVVIGKALQDGYAQKVKVATKLPCPDITSASDFDRCLNEQLKKLHTEKIDFYLLHHLNKANWTKVRGLGVLEWADKKIKDGYIGYFGFSFHDSFELLQEIINAYDNWTICQIQYNYMDEDFQAGTKGLEYAYQKGLAVVVMEPIRGGRLSNPPEKVAKEWAEAPFKRSPQEWALRWVWNHPEVAVTLSGMSKMQHVVENVAAAAHSQPRNLTSNELKIIERARDAYMASGPVSCTSCRYCMPCPNGVDIPRIFSMYNEAVIFNAPEKPRKAYCTPRNFNPEQRADKCIKCGDCLEKCPQKLPVTEMLEKAHEYLTAKT